MSPVLYRGSRAPDGHTPQVLKCVDDLTPVPLPLYLDVRAHADGPNWGGGGNSGTRQLALALLVDVMGDEYQELSNAFKREVISRLPFEGFTITAEEVEAWATSFDPPPPQKR